MTPYQKSMVALQDCMNAIGLRLDEIESEPIWAKIENIVGGRGEGGIHVTFHNDVYGHTGPYISFDETIRGFGLQYQQYKPQFQTFKLRFEDNDARLRIEGDDYGTAPQCLFRYRRDGPETRCHAVL
ncbi:hypothetical protein SBC2_81350 (plasmid) [Caballeronia sp. SBC2]|nr:hypothetical protein SBC2_81350 [Caballeronia sp. SBC2]